MSSAKCPPPVSNRASSRLLTGFPIPCGATCSREVKNDIDPRSPSLSVEWPYSGAWYQPARRLAQRGRSRAELKFRIRLSRHCMTEVAHLGQRMAGQRTTVFHATEARRLALVNGCSGARRPVPAAKAERPLSVRSGDLQRGARSALVVSRLPRAAYECAPAASDRSPGSRACRHHQACRRSYVAALLRHASPGAEDRYSDNPGFIGT